MKHYTLIIFALLLFGLIGCASVNVNVNYDENVDFSAYQTFRFQKPRAKQDRGAVNNQLFAKDVLSEIRPIMESKGFTEAGTGEQADLFVIFYAHTENQSDWVPGTYRVGRWGRVHRMSPGHTVRYKTGTLVIDIVDRVKKELVWQGIGNGVLDRQNPGKDLVNAVNDILATFPPQ
jgi:hypothetical protein